MTIVNKLDFPLIVDRITEGKGNCFPAAILDQCKRPEIYKILPPSMKRIVNRSKDVGQMQLRIAIKNFIQSSNHPKAIQFKRNYQQNVATLNNESWEQYWNRIIQDKVWVDYFFIQATAWFLRYDIMIVTTSNTDENPVITISGNIEDENTACPNAALTIGSKSNVHYQSLLPIEAFHLKNIPCSNQKQTDIPLRTNSKNLQQNRQSQSPISEESNPDP